MDEAAGLGFGDVLFTAGEPFILDDLYHLLACSAERVRTTVLTNARLLRGKRLDRLTEVARAAPAGRLIA